MSCDRYLLSQGKRPEPTLKTKARALSLAVLSPIVALPAVATAQQDQNVRQYEEVVITGSRIKRADLESSSPVAVISRVELEAAGAADVGEVLRRLPAVTGASSSNRTGGDTDGITTIDLRGIGDNNTLVLINGRRAVQRDIDGQVDLSSVPMEVVERIEVLKDGASAVYGSDAIAGVVNIITKKNFEGLMINAERGQSRYSDADNRYLSLTWGAEHDKGSFLVNVARRAEDGYFRRDREISKDADLRRFGDFGNNMRSSRSPATRIRDADGGTLIPGLSGTITAKDGVVITPGDPLDPNDFRDWLGQWGNETPCNISGTCDSFNYHDFESASNDHETTSLFLSSDYRINDHARAYAEINITNLKSLSIFAPAAIDFREAFDNVRAIVSADNIYNPFGVDLNIQRRITENGIVRPKFADVNTRRIILGLDGKIGDSEWDYDIGVNLQESSGTETRGDQISLQRVRTAMGPSFVDSGGVARCGTPGEVISGCVPINMIGPFGSITREMQDYIFVNKPFKQTENQISALLANFTGPLFDMPAGTAYLATGLEVRHEDATVNYDRATNTGDIAFIEAQEDTDAPTRKINELYAELLLPLHETVDLELAVRYSDYNDFGSTTNPKVGIKWSPTEDLTIRGTVSEGFRAPTFGELYKGNALGFQNGADPCEGPNFASLPGCNGIQSPNVLGYTIRTGGTEELEPEESESFTAGIVYTPSQLEGLSITVDYWEIEQKNVVDTIDSDFIVQQNATTGTLFADAIRRDPTTNELISVDVKQTNIGKREMAGWDLSVRYSLPDTAWGGFDFTFDYAYMDKWNDKPSPDADLRELAGTSTTTRTLPNDRWIAGIRWYRDNYDANWSLTYIGDLDDLGNLDANDNPYPVDDYFKNDAQFSYMLHDYDAKVTLGIDNVFDEEPPRYGATVRGGHDSYTYSSRGRFYYFRASKTF